MKGSAKESKRRRARHLFHREKSPLKLKEEYPVIRRSGKK